MEPNNMDIILVLGAFAGMLTGFFAIIKYITGQGLIDRTDDRKERQALTEAINTMAASNVLIAQATTKGNKEAKQRNGHLGEQNVQITKLITDQNRAVDAIRSATEQSAATSTRVEHLLESSAAVLADNTEILAKGTAQVAKALVDNGQQAQHVENQVVAHQIVSNKESSEGVE